MNSVANLFCEMLIFYPIFKKLGSICWGEHYLVEKAKKLYSRWDWGKRGRSKGVKMAKKHQILNI